MSLCVFDHDGGCANMNVGELFGKRCIEADNLLKTEQTLCKYHYERQALYTPEKSDTVDEAISNRACLYLFNGKCAHGLCLSHGKSCPRNSGESCGFFIPEYKFIETEKQGTSQSDNVSHPSHYVDGRKYEPKDVIRDWNLNFNLGSAVKYISRAGRKDDIIQDLKKAKQFIDFEIEALERESQTFP